jgi:integrase
LSRQSEKTSVCLCGLTRRVDDGRLQVHRQEGTVYFVDSYFKGKRIREAVGPNKKEAQEYLGKKPREIRDEELFGIKKREEILFCDFCDIYKNWASHRRSSTFGYNLDIFKRHFVGKYLHEITAKEIDDFILTRRDTPTKRGNKKRKGYSVNREVNDLSPIFTLARRSASKDVHLIILLALETGMRRGEIFNLRWDDLDYTRNQIWVRESKNGDARHAPMRPRSKEALLRRPRRIDCDYIFPGRVGKTRASTGLVETFTNLLTRAGIKDFRFHDLRHTFASHLVMAGVDLFTVGKLLGHRHTAMTARYSHLSEGHLHRAVDNLPDWDSAAGMVPVGIKTEDGQKLVRREKAA